jgi:5-methylcytosine-specific restriction protein A
MDKTAGIELVEEYKAYLRDVRGLVEGTVNSYPTYLQAIVNHTKIKISPHTITSDESVVSLLDQLKVTLTAKNYWGNCQSALKAYLVFLKYRQNYITQNLYPDELRDFTEGNVSTITVNKYERNTKARNACIAHHGIICKACNLDFEKVYGELGKGFIHVHHTKPLHTIKFEYIVDPINDLLPLCPNCHAMIHKGKELISVDQLKEKIRRNT